jgi:hypothetical protein
VSGLLDAVKAAIYRDGSKTREEMADLTGDAAARAAVEAVAAWLDGYGKYRNYAPVVALLRAEVAPPRPTPVDVIREAEFAWHMDVAVRRATSLKSAAPHIAAALRDAGMLVEGTP